MRIEREREIIKTGQRSTEATWSLTSLDAERAGLEELLALVRNRWVTAGTSRTGSTMCATSPTTKTAAGPTLRHLPRNLSCLTNVTIAIVRCDGRFRHLPEANRYFVARVQEALDAILIAPAA